MRSEHTKIYGNIIVIMDVFTWMKVCFLVSNFVIENRKERRRRRREIYHL